MGLVLIAIVSGSSAYAKTDEQVIFHVGPAYRLLSKALRCVHVLFYSSSVHLYWRWGAGA